MKEDERREEKVPNGCSETPPALQPELTLGAAELSSDQRVQIMETTTMSKPIPIECAVR